MSDIGTNIRYAEGPSRRIGPLLDIPSLLGEFSVSLEMVLVASLLIEPTAFSDPAQRVPYSAVGQLLRRCAEAADCPHFGLLLGSRHNHRCLGALGLWMQNAPDLKAALSGFTRLQGGNSRGGVAYLQRYNEAVFLGYGIYDRNAVAHEHIYALVTALAFNILKALTRGAVRPAEVLFSFRRPRDTKPYSDFFGAPLRFDQPESGLVLTLPALATPIPSARPDEFQTLRRLVESAVPVSDRPWTDRVRRAIRPLLLRGEPTGVSLAAHLGVHLRTLSRRLADEGVNFQHILDDVRYTMARELLAVTDLRIGDIAEALSYSAHAAFVDAFRRWSGVTPTTWREDVRGRDARATAKRITSLLRIIRS